MMLTTQPHLVPTKIFKITAKNTKVLHIHTLVKKQAVQEKYIEIENEGSFNTEFSS
jgi:hypothetical protein